MSESTKAVKKIENKKPKVKKPSAFKRLKQFLKEMVNELKRVHWPTRKELIKTTGSVIVFVIIMAAVIGGLDTIFGSLFKLIYKI